MPAGHRLQDLQVLQLLWQGTTSAVYAAVDNRRERRLALKEYLPSELALRRPDGRVVARSVQAEAAFNAGHQAFLNEAQLLADVKHPALVPVLRHWEQDGTAYQLMPLVEGATLGDWLQGLGTPPSEVWLRGMLPPVMDALEALHVRGAHHGDVSLCSIWLQFSNRAESYLDQASQPLLLGLGAASRAIAQAGAGYAPALRDGFGAVEHADGALTVRRGGWTDIYALCAVLYTAIAGRPPPPSMTRMARDDMVSAPKVGRGRYSRGFLAAIDAGLAVRPHERLQSIDALRELLAAPAAGISGYPSSGLGDSVPGPVSSPRPLLGIPPKPPLRQGPPSRWIWPAVLGSLLLVLAAAGLLLRPA